MQPPRKPQIGSISHGTLKTYDLLEAFSAEARYLGIAPTLVERAEAALDNMADENDPDELVADLQDVLNDSAPPYLYFGSHEGDGSDFGWWPLLEDIETLPRIAEPDPDLAKACGEDCRYVNDHGNVTVYAADGSVLIELV